MLGKGNKPERQLCLVSLTCGIFFFLIFKSNSKPRVKRAFQWLGGRGNRNRLVKGHKLSFVSGRAEDIISNMVTMADNTVLYN